jgi:hypothetical protein
MLPAVSAAISAPTSKSAAWTETLMPFSLARAAG